MYEEQKYLKYAMNIMSSLTTPASKCVGTLICISVLNMKL